MIRNLALLALGLCCMSSGRANAQDAITNHALSLGLKAYYSFDYPKAYETFTAAINAQTPDPRCYYFRGLSLLHLGRETEAQADFQYGSQLESNEQSRSFNIGKTLERIQGPDRTLLESYRVKARVTAMERDNALRRNRYEATRQEQNRVLQQQVEQIPAPPVKSGEKSPADAFQSGPLTGAAAAEKPATAAPAADKPAMENPAAEPKAAEKPPEKPAADDPFGAPAAKEKPAAKPAEDDPFGAPAKPAAKEKAAAKPAEDDPFGAPAKPAGKAAAKAAAADDPFGGATPAKPAKRVENQAEEPAAPTAKPAAGGAAAPAGGAKKSGGLFGAIGRAVEGAAASDDGKAPAAAAPAK